MTAVAYTLGALCAVWLLAAAVIAVMTVRTRVPAACRDDAWAPEAVPIPGADEACALTQDTDGVIAALELQFKPEEHR